MNGKPMTAMARVFLALIAGFAAAYVTGFLLSPFVNLYIDNNVRFFNTATEDDMMWSVVVCMWAFLASFAGGSVCVLVSSYPGYLLSTFNSIILSASLLIFAISLAGIPSGEALVTAIFLILSIFLGNYLGATLVIRIGLKKKNNQDEKF